MVYKKIYKNGLRVVHEQNNKDVIAINILFYVGSQNEEYHQQGYSHFIEHLNFKSSKDYTTEEIMDKLTMLGADYNAYTSRTATRYTFKCLKENFEECFKIYANMLLFAKFDDEEINKEREVVIEEMKKCADDPVQVMYERVMTNYFGDSPYAHDELGREEIISTVSRQELLDYKNQYYKPENCVISVVGNIDNNKLNEIIEQYYALNFSYEAKNYKVNFDLFEPKNIKTYDVVKRDDNQVNVCIHIKSITCTSDKKHTADIYSSILGNSQNSRLFKLIREELGLVYTIYSFNILGANSGELFIIFGTRAKNVKKAIAEIKRVINDMAEKGITTEELERSKNWKKSCLVYNAETNSEIAEQNGTMEHLFERINNISELVECYNSVTVESVNAFAKQIQNEQVFNVVAVGKEISVKDLTF